MTHDLLMALGRGALAASLALALVLAGRVPARRWLGAAFAYRLWLLVPVAALATLLPAPMRPLIPAAQVAPSVPLSSAPIELQAAMTQAASFDWQPWLLALWIIGALALVIVFARQQRSYLKNLGALSAGDHGALRAQATEGCPALVGAWRPRIVVPSDFELRYTQQERELVLVHERTHLARGDAQINALAALLRCLNWFNPLFHLAASRFRFDQEIACDAAVMSRFPEARRCYADAMLKAQLVGRSRQELRLPAGCHWPQSHPLKERIAMLKFPAMTRVRRTLSGVAIAALTLSAGYTSWAAQPGRAPTAQGAAASAADSATQNAMVQTEFAITIDGKHIMDTRDTQLGEDQPAEGGWNVEFNTTRDGVARSLGPSHISILNRIGQPFEVTAKKGDETWRVTAVSTPRADGSIAFDVKVTHKDVLVTTPSLIVADGTPSAFEIKDGPAQGFKFDFTLSKVYLAAARPKLGGSVLKDAPPSEDAGYRRMYPPKYPLEAVRNRITGKVILKVAVDDRGVPTAAEVESVKPEESARVLADSAITAAMKWRFNPGIKDGVSVAGSVMVPIDYMLSDDNGNPMPPPDPVSDTNVGYRKMRPPVYPQDAIAGKVSGTLYVRAHIDAEGNVADAYVDQAVPLSALALKDSALAAVRGWQFNPATRNGLPSESDVLVPMQFRINGEAAAPNAAAPAYPDSVRRLEAIVVTGAAS